MIDVCLEAETIGFATEGSLLALALGNPGSTRFERLKHLERFEPRAVSNGPISDELINKIEGQLLKP
jgi:hypothetical protein